MKSFQYKIGIFCLFFLILTGCNAYHKIDNKSFESLVKKGATIIDVRSEIEYEQGHIPGAIWIPYYEIDTVTYTKNTKIIVYCRSGSRSKTAADILVGLGYQNVYDLGSKDNYKGELEKSD